MFLKILGLNKKYNTKHALQQKKHTLQQKHTINTQNKKIKNGKQQNTKTQKLSYGWVLVAQAKTLDNAARCMRLCKM